MHVRGEAARLLQPLLECSGQHAERELGVTDDRIVGRDVLVDVVRIDRVVHEHLVLVVRREADAESRRGEAGSRPEDHVGVLHVLEHGLGHRHAPGAQRQRMSFRERALALEAGGDGSLEELDDLLQLGPRFCVVHALTGVDEWPLGVDEHFGGGVDVGVARRGQYTPRRLVLERAGNFDVPHVAGHLQEHRTGPPIARNRERAPQRRHDHVRRVDLFGMLGDVLIVEHGVEARLDPRLAAARRAGHEDQGHALRPRLCDRAERILDAGARLAAEHSNLLTGGHATDGIRHVQPDTLLPDDDRADARRRAGLGQRIERIGEEELDALAFENLRRSLGNVHRTAPRTEWATGVFRRPVGGTKYRLTLREKRARRTPATVSRTMP